MKKSEKTFFDDREIVELYFARDEKAITETDAKYRGYLMTVAHNLLSDVSDCEECLSDTYLGAWNTIPPTRPTHLKAFLTTILRRCAIKRYRSNTKLRAVPSELTVSLSEIEDFVSGNGDVDTELDTAALGCIISSFVRSLSSRKRFIFMSRYYAAEPIDVIARELRVSRSTVNKELAAIRHGLKEQLESEGYII